MWNSASKDLIKYKIFFKILLSGHFDWGLANLVVSIWEMILLTIDELFHSFFRERFNLERRILLIIGILTGDFKSIKRVVLGTSCWLDWAVRLILAYRFSFLHSLNLLLLLEVNITSNRRHFSFQNIFKHLISQWNSIVFKPINSISTLLNDFCDELFSHALNHSLMHHPNSLNSDVRFILLIVDVLYRLLNDIDNKIIRLLVPLLAELYTVIEHIFEHPIKHLFGSLLIQPLILLSLQCL
jgi:hypothetical protein